MDKCEASTRKQALKSMPPQLFYIWDFPTFGTFQQCYCIGTEELFADPVNK
jgi:hypothetical protein